MKSRITKVVLCSPRRTDNRPPHLVSTLLGCKARSVISDVDNRIVCSRCGAWSEPGESLRAAAWAAYLAGWTFFDRTTAKRWRFTKFPRFLQDVECLCPKCSAQVRRDYDPDEDFAIVDAFSIENVARAALYDPDREFRVTVLRVLNACCQGQHPEIISALERIENTTSAALPQLEERTE